jgi:hypothetical protein
MKSLRDIRVIPVVLVAIFGLAVLKVAGLVIDGGYVFDYQPQTTRRSWAQEAFNFPTGKNNAADITGSRLKADEHSLKAVIAELITATEIAERARSGLVHRASCAVVRFYVAKFSAYAAEAWARSHGATEAEIEAARRCLRDAPARTARAGQWTVQ